MIFEKIAVALIRAAPKGYYRLARGLRSVWPSLRECRVETRYGSMVCDIADGGCFPLVKFGGYPHWAEDEIAIAALPLDKHSLVVDVGANIGATVLLFSKLAGSVIAFEPSPKALKLLNLNVPANAIVYPVALSDFEGSAVFEERDSLDLSSFSDQGITVPVRTLDSFGLQPDLIKIDVEGFEPQVLRGATETLKYRPIVIFEALNEEAVKLCRAELPDGYEIARISKFNYLASPMTT